MIPVKDVQLTVDDLLLRPWRPADADAVYRACQDPVLQRWSVSLPVPYPREAARAFVGELAPRLLADGTGLNLGIFDAGTGDLLGSTALNGIRQDHRSAELGYWSAPAARGRRVTERASRALLRHGFHRMGLRRVEWKASVGNHASRLTGLRLGVRIIGVAEDEQRARDGEPVDRWVGSLLPGGLTAAGTDVPDRVRRRALLFGGPQPTLPGAGGVRLRPPQERDLAGIAASCRDPEALRFTTVPDPYTEADAAFFALRHAPAVWARGTGAVFVIAGPDDAHAGTMDVRLSAADDAVADVGFLMAPQARCRGYATAALRALTAWAVPALALDRFEWKAHVDNAASRRVAEKAGFTIEGVQRAGIAHRGERRDCLVGAALPADLP